MNLKGFVAVNNKSTNDTGVVVAIENMFIYSYNDSSLQRLVCFSLAVYCMRFLKVTYILSVMNSVHIDTDSVCKGTDYK